MTDRQKIISKLTEAGELIWQTKKGFILANRQFNFNDDAELVSIREQTPIDGTERIVTRIESRAE